jgi:hypothetical protein
MGIRAAVDHEVAGHLIGIPRKSYLRTFLPDCQCSKKLKADPLVPE